MTCNGKSQNYNSFTDTRQAAVIQRSQQFYRHTIGSSHSEESTVRFLCCYVEFLVLTISKQWQFRMIVSAESSLLMEFDTSFFLFSFFVLMCWRCYNYGSIIHISNFFQNIHIRKDSLFLINSVTIAYKVHSLSQIGIFNLFQLVLTITGAQLKNIYSVTEINYKR